MVYGVNRNPVIDPRWRFLGSFTYDLIAILRKIAAEKLMSVVVPTSVLVIVLLFYNADKSLN